jgi:citrate synthase
MRAFWREKPLSLDDQDLLVELNAAHYKAAFRQNLSGVAIVCAAQGNGSYFSSMIAGLSTFGEKHGPIVQTYDLLQCDARMNAGTLLDEQRPIPGWGNSFVKGKPDPDWRAVDKLLYKLNPDLHNVMDDITNLLGKNGKMVFPNPSAYTAATALTLGMPRRLSPYLLAMSRLEAWAQIFNDETKGT